MSARRPLTVAHVTAEDGFSGGEVQVFLLMEGLRKQGHRNLLICPPGSRAEEEAGRRGLECRAVRMRSDWSLGAAVHIARRLNRARPDLVHLHSGRAVWLGGLAARALGLPALATRRMDRRLRRSRRNRFLYGRALARCVAISRSVADQLAAAGVPQQRIRLIPSAVDPAQLHPQRDRDAVRAELEGAAEAPCVLVAAALVRRKGIDVLIEALAELASRGLHPNVWIAGDGPERGALVALARQRGLVEGVRFLGRRDDVADLLNACDICVLPSRREGLGVAALEAMASGRPVVASRVGGLADAVVDGETGLLVPAEDPAALAAALAELLNDAELRRRLGAGGPARVNAQHLADAMVEAYERVYAEVLAASP